MRMPRRFRLSVFARDRGSVRGSATGRATHEAEELVVRVDHDHVARLEGVPVRLHALIKLVELRVVAERVGRDGRCLGIALALDGLRLTLAVGENRLLLRDRRRP